MSQRLPASCSVIDCAGSGKSTVTRAVKFARWPPMDDGVLSHENWWLWQERLDRFPNNHACCLGLVVVLGEASAGWLAPCLPVLFSLFYFWKIKLRSIFFSFEGTNRQSSVLQSAGATGESHVKIIVAPDQIKNIAQMRPVTRS